MSHQSKVINNMADPILQTQDNDAPASIQQRFCQGDAAAFNVVVECYLPDIQRLTHRLVAWGGEADDVVQDVFTAAFVNCRKYRADSSLKTWLFSITINTCRTRNRRRLLWRKFVKKHSVDHRPSVCHRDDTFVQEQNEKVRLAVRRLPAKYRDAIVLKYLEELPTSEILDILKISEQAFYTRLNRGRNFLQEDLSDYLGNEK